MNIGGHNGIGANILTGLKGEGLDIQRLEFFALWHSQSVVFQGYKFSGNFSPQRVKKLESLIKSDIS